MHVDSEMFEKLLMQLKAQDKTTRAALKAINKTLALLAERQAPPAEAEFVPEPEPDTRTEEEQLKDAIRRERFDIQRALSDRHVPSQTETPSIEAYIEECEWENMKEIREYTFVALLHRDFGKKAADLYRSRRMNTRLFERVAYFYYNCAAANLLETDEALLAEAARLEQEALHPTLPPLKPTAGAFCLPGRKRLEAFFNDEVVEIVNHYEAYQAMGIGFPKPFILEGAPGCGKTYAVEALAKHLNWYTIHLTASNVGSEMVHKTPKLIEEKFEEAAKHAPAIIIVDEMDAFMPDRGSKAGDHHAVVEEVSSFLKCLQTAAEKRVLVVGMTNYLRRIDPAILRTGRMGTHLSVGMPDAEEVESVLAYELSKRPHAAFALRPVAEQLLGRPLSDVSFVVEKAARTAVRNGHRQVEYGDVTAAMALLPCIAEAPAVAPRRIGFAA